MHYSMYLFKFSGGDGRCISLAFRLLWDYLRISHLHIVTQYTQLRKGKANFVDV